MTKRKKEDRQHNVQKKKTNNFLQNTQKTKDRTIRTPLKTGVVKWIINKVTGIRSMDSDNRD